MGTMFAKFIVIASVINVLSLFALWGTAGASELRPGRCVTITETGKAPRVVCSVPKGER